LPALTKLAKSFLHVPTTSGAGTGVPITEEALARLSEAVKADAPSFPLGLASGVDEENIRSFLPYVDFFLVASGVEQTSDDPQTIQFYQEAMMGRPIKVGFLDGEKIQALADQIHAFSS